MKYSLDTSSILEGWVRSYPPDVFPALWVKLDELINSCDLKATKEVLFELSKKQDEVFRWAKNRSNMFIPIDHQIQSVVSNILRDYPGLVDIRTGRTQADCFVIALAKINGASVVTEEMPSLNKLKKPKIPDVCDALGIPSMNFLSLIREQGWVFNR